LAIVAELSLAGIILEWTTNEIAIQSSVRMVITTTVCNSYDPPPITCIPKRIKNEAEAMAIA